MSFRGGGNRGGRGRIMLPFGLEYSDIKQESEATIEKPKYVLPVYGAPIFIEELAAKRSIAFAKLMSEGPFYTANLDNIKLSTASKNAMAHSRKEKFIQDEIDNNIHNVSEDGIERYSDRYKKKKKVHRTIEDHPYQLQFFPEELYSVMGVSSKQKRKLLSLSKFKSNGGLRQFVSEERKEIVDEDEKTKSKELTEQLFNQFGNDDDNKEDNKEEHSDSEDIDDEFEDEEDNDYNAERYFDDGEEGVGEDEGDEEAEF
ncbi:RPC31 [Candida oxycetoniae]|uniref:DNA-directed RNA polymerase III subunit n=1 Tax=Candida oxycetoniae TaxID=497107 RepID=A0AAI9SWH8_9ASCO|nr:RPC31 [Candida oxycetoniae]KAI3403825.2 RPC31 [Candida oxycetoniae]